MQENHKVNTKNIPALIMLLAGAVASVAMLVTGTDTKRFLITLLIVLVIFYIIGSIVKVILDKSFKIMEATPYEFEGDLSESLDSANRSEGDSREEDRDNYVVEEREL